MLTAFIGYVLPWGQMSFWGATVITNFVSAIENRQGIKIACLEEIALKNKWINKKNIEQSIKFYGKCEYSNYLKKLIHDTEN